MRFTVLVTGIENPRSKAIVAHNLAGNRGVSLQLAMSLLENLPVLYQANLSKEDAAAAVARLAKIGVKAHAVVPEMDPIKENRPTAEGPQPTPAADTASMPAEKPVLSEEPRPRFSYIGRAVINPESKTAHSRKAWKTLAPVFAVCLATLAVMYAHSKKSFLLPVSPASGGSADSMHQTPPAQKKTGHSLSPSGDFAGGADAEQNVSKGRDTAYEQARTAAQAFIDSAKARPDAREAVSFYKMALSFNKRNIDAWYGLINAYMQASMPEEADKARADMKKIFGEGVFSIARAVGRFGDLIDLSATDEGTFRVEYRSRQTGQNELVHESFLLGKALAIQCRCAAISLYVRGAGGKSASAGALVFFKTDPLPLTFEGFQSAASVTYLR